MTLVKTMDVNTYLVQRIKKVRDPIKIGKHEQNPFRTYRAELTY